MKLKFAVVCDYALASSDNKLGVLGIFDQINPPALPFVLPGIYMVASLEGEASEGGREFRLEILLWDADGNQLFVHDKPMQFSPPAYPGGQSTYNEIVALHGVPLKTAGEYCFIVRVNNEERGRARFRVNEPRQVG